MERPDPHRSLADVPPMPERPTFRDHHQVVRFYPNKIVRYLLDAATRRGALDLNAIVNLVAHDEFTAADLNEFYQLIGYSVSGYDELQPIEETITDPNAAPEA